MGSDEAPIGEGGRGAADGGAITLGVLTAVEADSSVSQRALARRLGIALGLANAYLRRCVRKGYIKVRQVPTNRYAYYITPKGFAEKSRLTVEYLSSSLSFFRIARRQCTRCLEDCLAGGHRRVALVGAGDLADIAALCAREVGITLVAVVDAEGGRVPDLPTVASAAAAAAAEAFLVTDVRAPQATYEGLMATVGDRPIVVPPLLNVSPPPRAPRR